ncbi:hypothetical protein FPZ24_04980 [Sphingomonas panacisoli]|uniref:Uncharacterized protein n=1 Tax=Sphingomonas panacisoli TaxID=1813879 RepID=A0A5B8LGZ9_9SPHN|nr:hypothetical protein [Sphingomonas panacisoli]QDZ06914.1 hypothetical protein FPZ24_04980 [Sphingomonas panacisoli]
MTDEAEIEQVRRTIDEGRVHIAKQKEIIAEREAAGSDSSEPREFLLRLEEGMQGYVAQLETLERQAR